MFLYGAPVGAVVVYHRGFLARDRVHNTSCMLGVDAWTDNYTPIHEIANLFLDAYNNGTVTLYQRRWGPNDYEYFARKVPPHDQETCRYCGRRYVCQ